MNLISTAFKYLRRYPGLTTSTLFSIAIASLFEGASFGMLIPLIQNMTDTGTNLLENAPFIGHVKLLNSQHGSISVILALFFIIIIVKNIFVYVSNISITRLRFGITRDLSVELMNSVIGYDLKYFDNVKTGHIISNLSNETRRMGDFMLSVLQMVTLAARISIFIVLMFFISTKASIAIFIFMALVLLPLELIMKKLKRLSSAASAAFLDYTHKLAELLSGIRLVKISVMEEPEKKVFARAADAVYRSQYDCTKHIYAFIPLSEVLIFGLIILMVFTLIHLVKIDIRATFPFIATYLVVLVRMLTQLNAFNSMRASAVSNFAAFRAYEEMRDHKGKKEIISGARSIGGFRDSIEFKNVNFSYDGKKRVLENINVKIVRGKITAIVGMSGSGKSTMVNLMPRLYDTDSGAILIDGIDIKDLDLDEWRRKIGFVSQDAFIFNASVKENVAYGCVGTSDEEIIRAARVANAHDFIVSLPQKYDTVLGERGVKLSGGQKQRMSIARAIIHDPEILILDEATSSLDTETERLIKNAIDAITKNRTVIAIAHRLSTVINADNIVVLDKGKVIEEGSHSDLVDRNGLYKKFYDVQFSVLEK